MLVWDAGELLSMELPDGAQNESILVVITMLAVRWLRAYAGTNEQELTVPTPDQLSETTCRILRIPKAIEARRPISPSI